MKDYTPTNPDEESPDLAKQRRSLDVMSAQLTHNLNKMIAEQEQRVRAFAAQQPSAPVPGADMPRQSVSWQRPAEPVTPAPKPRTAAGPVYTQQPLPPTPPQQPVPTQQTPPPLPKKKKASPLPPDFTPPTSPDRWRQSEKKEGQIGPGCIITIIVVVLIMLRACT